MLNGQTGSDTSTLRPVETWSDGKRVYYKFKLTKTGQLPRIYHDGAPGTWILNNIQIEKGEVPTEFQYDDIQEDLNNPANYMWQLTKGKDGEKGATGLQGAPGTPGKDGKTPYYHLAYANKDSSGAFIGFTFTDDKRQYKGSYVDYNQESSTNPSKYTWEKSIWQIEQEKANQIDINNVIEILSRTQEKINAIDTTLNVTKDNAIITHSAEYITTIEKLVGNADNSDQQLKLLQQMAEKIDTYFIFDDAFTIGKSDSKNKVRVTNEELQFLNGETLMAYMSGVYTVMKNAKVQGSLELNNHKFTSIGSDITAVVYIGE